MKTIAKLIGTFFLLSLLAACGGGGGGASFTGGASGGSSGSTGPAHTIALSYPISDSIENLGGGFYRRIGTATVTDANGKVLPDGTKVHLEVIDSIIAWGAIGDEAGDDITGTTLTDDNPLLTDAVGATDTTTFMDASVTRTTGSGDTRFIQANDEVLLLGLASGIDKRRFVAAAPSATNSLTVKTAYSTSYPNATYEEPVYIVGASLLGASVAGVGADDNATPGVATMSNGTATFYVTYPANVNTIMTGCGISNIDTRSLPLGSADVYLVARTADGKVMNLDNGFCFTPIDGFSVDAFPSSATMTVGADLEVSLTVEDGGDGVRVPFYPALVAVSTTGTAAVTITNSVGDETYFPVDDDVLRTDDSGIAIAKINLTAGAADDTVTITFRFSDTDVTFEITVL